MTGRVAPAAGRNREPLLAVLRARLPAGLLLEVASGSGEHALWFSTALPHVTWQPSDRDPEARASIAAWRDAEGPPNLLPPLALDAAAAEWPVARADAMLSVNMIHIAPWEAAEGLLAGAGRILPSGGVLVLYGPFREARTTLAAGNAEFDADLRRRDPAWGLRDVAEVSTLGERHGLGLIERVEMPANNLTLVFRRD